MIENRKGFRKRIKTQEENIRKKCGGEKYES